MESLGTLLPILLLGAAFYLLIIRPSRNRQQQAQAVLRKLEPGARVMTTAGLFGTLTSVDDDEVELEIAPGVRVRYVKAAIAKVVDEVETTGTTSDAATSVGEGDTPEA